MILCVIVVEPPYSLDCLTKLLSLERLPFKQRNVTYISSAFWQHLCLSVQCNEDHNVCLLQKATRVTAARYGVQISPSFLVPSNCTGCLGVMNNYESLLPNKKALFDIPVARTAIAYLTSLLLAVAAFVAYGSFNGGDNAL